MQEKGTHKHTNIFVDRFLPSTGATGNLKCKKKAHKLFCPVGLGTTPGLCFGDFTGFVPGTKPVKTCDKPGFSPLFYTGSPDFTGFVPGTSPVKVPGQSRKRRAAQKDYVKKVYVPFSLAKEHACFGADVHDFQWGRL